MLPGNREALVIGGHDSEGGVVLDFGTMFFTPGPEMVTWRDGCAVVLLPGAFRVLSRRWWLG